MNKKACLVGLMAITLIASAGFAQRKLPRENGANEKEAVSDENIRMFIVCDNDFAVFTGSNNEIKREIYQNNDEWPQQISLVSNIKLQLKEDEDTIYILALGGGGVEDIGGTLSGKDISKLKILQSSNIKESLKNYDSGVIASGKYQADLNDIKNVFKKLTWSSPTVKKSGCSSSVTGTSLAFPSGTAVLFKINASDIK